MNIHSIHETTSLLTLKTDSSQNRCMWY